MRGSFTLDLALGNLRRNRRSTLPYALSCAGTVMICFIMVALANTPTLRGVYGGRTIQRTLQMGVWVMLLFAVVFLFYTHSFLIRQRKKELGLFNILGLEKRHIARVLLVESFLVGTVTTLAGMGLGALLTRLLYLAQLRMLGALQSPRFIIPGSTWVVIGLAFACIHLLTVLNTLRQVQLARPVELLRAGSLGEKPPKARFGLALLGLLLLGGGYYLSLSAKDALNSISQFFLAVLLVIAATYVLFSAGTIAALRLMQKNKDFYYRPTRFTVVAGMRHRMKRHAVGLASICILSTMVLVMMSTTVSLFMGKENALQSRFPRQTMLAVDPINTPQEAGRLDAAVRHVTDTLGIEQQNPVTYESRTYMASYDPQTNGFPKAITEFRGDLSFDSVSLIALADYRAATGSMVNLAPGQALAFTQAGPELTGQTSLGDMPLTIVGNPQDLALLAAHVVPVAGRNVLLVLGEEDLEKASRALEQESALAHPDRTLRWNPRARVLMFDTGTLGIGRAEELVSSLRDVVSEYIRTSATGGGSSFVQQLEVDRADFNAVYGGLLFVSIFLGLVFLMALVLIIYYKQLSEGYEDQARFQILQQVGMSNEEVKRSVRTQVLMVFFLPLLMAGLHLLASFNITARIVRLLNLTNLQLFARVTLVTYLLFAVFYLLVYWKTAGSYYRVVKAAKAA